ncbi:MAG TPA: hypothetical protein VHC18_06740 [Amycolatopsis sp.]|nr:hypothetical protein [Amycolatopsis sp.]
MTNWYHAHGLVIASEVDLPLPSGEPGQADLVLRRGEDRSVPATRGAGEQLAELRNDNGKVFYRLTRDGDRALLRYPGLCDFVADRDLRDVTAHLQPGSDPGLIPVLAAGALLAVHLMLRHCLVLHASAVRLNGQAVAFVGASGMGKSTLATAMCGIGCDLVADDVLHVDSGMRVHPGSTETRLRAGAWELADAAPSHAVRTTADGRLALRPSARVSEPLPLVACVVPRPSRDVDEVLVQRLAPGRALLRMCQFPRLLGWTDPTSTSFTFQALGDLVEAVPVFEAIVPWGPPFRREVLSGLLDAVA